MQDHTRLMSLKNTVVIRCRAVLRHDLLTAPGGSLGLLLRLRHDRPSSLQRNGLSLLEQTAYCSETDSKPQQPCRTSNANVRLQEHHFFEASERVMRQDCRTLILCAGLGLLAAGCPKGHSEYDLGAKAENLQDYDAALDYYQKAVKVDPHNATFRIRLNQARFEAGEMHIKRGLEMRKRGELDGAVLEFQKALAADPSSSIADQELNRTAEIIAEKNHANEAPPP